MKEQVAQPPKISVGFYRGRKTNGNRGRNCPVTVNATHHKSKNLDRALETTPRALAIVTKLAGSFILELACAFVQLENMHLVDFQPVNRTEPRVPTA